MECLRIVLRPLSAFGGPIRGDTLFGQICWAALHRWGEARLEELLAGYTVGRPFAVCSDAFPVGHLPRPALPLHRFDRLEDEDRKAVKGRRWLPLEAVAEPVPHWLAACRGDAQVLAALGQEGASRLAEGHAQARNSINRLSGTTGGAEFAPYAQPQLWFHQAARLDCWLLLDTERLAREEAHRLLRDIGLVGYGRDAGIGLGKFAIEGLAAQSLPCQPEADACFTLAPCSPQGLGLDPGRSHYQIFTRFGRHGDRAVHTGLPFKAPALMADTGAVLSGLEMPHGPFIGQGIGGDGSLSNAIPETVQQGYAPFIGVRLGESGA